jgi:hypothetical protein
MSSCNAWCCLAGHVAKHYLLLLLLCCGKVLLALLLLLLPCLESIHETRNAVC